MKHTMEVGNAKELNARLIAAAPELYETLAHMCNIFKPGNSPDSQSHAEQAIWRKAVDLLDSI